MIDLQTTDTIPFTHCITQSTLSNKPSQRPIARIANHLRIRVIRILTEVHLPDKRLQIRRRDRQVHCARRLFRSKGQGIGHGAVDEVDARLMDCGAGGVPEEVVLGGQDDGGLGGLLHVSLP